MSHPARTPCPQHPADSGVRSLLLPTGLPSGGRLTLFFPGLDPKEGDCDNLPKLLGLLKKLLRQALVNILTVVGSLVTQKKLVGFWKQILVHVLLSPFTNVGPYNLSKPQFSHLQIKDNDTNFISCGEE